MKTKILKSNITYSTGQQKTLFLLNEDMT